MSRMGIIVNVDECIGCHACFIACKQENQVSPNIQWNRIRKVENREKNIINYLKKDCCFHTKKVWGRQSFFLIFVYIELVRSFRRCILSHAQLSGGFYCGVSF